MKVTRIENEAWPKDTYEIEHNNVSLYIIPVPDGLEIDTRHQFHVVWNDTDEQLELTFFEFQELEKT